MKQLLAAMATTGIAGVGGALAVYGSYDDSPGGTLLGIVIVLGASRDGLERYFDDVEQAAMIDCGHCMPYENNRPVFVARGLKVPLDTIWQDIKNYD